MTTAVLDAKTLDAKTHEFDVEDTEYLRHGDKPLLARVFRPRGEGPFPALVECHGGAWCMSDRTTERLRHEFMASHGIVSIALDFRSGNEDPYSASPGSRAAGISPCSSPCARAIRAMPRSRFRPARARTMRARAAS